MVLLIFIAAVIALAFILISLFLFFALFVGYPSRAVLARCGMCEKELDDQTVGNFCGHCYPISVGAL